MPNDEFEKWWEESETGPNAHLDPPLTTEEAVYLGLAKSKAYAAWVAGRVAVATDCAARGCMWCQHNLKTHEGHAARRDANSITTSSAHGT